MMDRDSLEMEGHLVSVIIPVYGVESYLIKCIESICGQSYKNLEIILVDDGGIDSCPMICDQYAEKDSRIQVIHKKNGGLSDARNAGLEIHKGRYIFFVDGDDLIHPDTIKDLLNIAEKEEADIVECGFFIVDEKDIDIFIDARSDGQIERYGHDEAVEKILDYQFKIMAWNKLYRSELFEKIRFPVGKLHEDEFTIPYLVDECKKYIVCSDRYYAYVQRNDSIMAAKYDERRLDVLEAHQGRIAFFSQKYPNRFEQVMNYHFFVACMHLKSIMRDGYKGSIVEDHIDRISHELLNDKALDLRIRIKVILYRVMPMMIIRLKKKYR